MKKPAQKQGNGRFPRSVARRILERGAQGEKAVVVLLKNGEPCAVWGFDEYVARKELAKTVKPWERRRSKKTAADPLGAVDMGKILLPLTRANMYDS